MCTSASCVWLCKGIKDVQIRIAGETKSESCLDSVAAAILASGGWDLCVCAASIT